MAGDREAGVVTFRTERGLAALERAAGELRLIVVRECGAKAPLVSALLDQSLRAAREAMAEVEV